MRVVLTSIGTTGDFRPLLALAVELRSAGHAPVVAQSPHLRDMVETLGLEFISVGPDLEKTFDRLNASSMAEPELYYSQAGVRSILEPLVQNLPQFFEELRSACRGADALVSGPAQPTARIVHEISGIPLISLQFSNFGGFGTPAFRAVSRELVNPFREGTGLPAVADPLTADANSTLMVLFAISKHLFARPAEWPPHHHLVGFFFLDDPLWQPGADLEEFCDPQRPLVSVAFGSMVHPSPRALLEMLDKTARELQLRFVVQLADPEVQTGRLSSNLYSIRYLAHQWLFPRSACVVHHGGSGTTAAVLRAGVPGVFVPHIYQFDQPYWALLAKRAGCCGPAIPIAELAPQSLQLAILEAMTNESMREKSAEIGRRVRGENGACRAAEMIDQVLSHQEIPNDVESGERASRRRSYRQSKLDLRRAANSIP